MKDNAAIAQPAAAKQYLSEMGLEEDCTCVCVCACRTKQQQLSHCCFNNSHIL
jgi:hypothetical protein